MTSQNQTMDYSPLITDIKNTIRTRLRALMSSLLDNAETALFELANSAKNNEDQRRYFELMRQLKEHKTDIAVNYLSCYEPVLRSYPVTEAEKSRHKLQAEDELSLVAQTEIEDMVLVKTIGERIAGRYREQLSHLEARLEHLALKTDDIFQKHALAPVKLCQAFDDALGDSFDITSKKILFNYFHDEFASKLVSLYEAINNKLIEADILPQIKIPMLSKPRNKPRPQAAMDPSQAPADNHLGDAAANYGYPGGGGTVGGSPGTATGGGGGGGAAPGGGVMPAGAHSHGGGGGPGPSAGHAPAGMANAGQTGGAGSGTGANTGAAMPTAAADTAAQARIAGQPQSIGGGYAMTAAPGQFFHGGTAANQALAATAPGQAASAQHAGQSAAPAPGAQATRSDGAYSHSVAGMPAEQVSQTIGDFLGAPIHKSGAEDVGGNPVFPGSTAQAFGHEEILTALSGVQSLPQFLHPTELRFDADAIKNAVVSELAKKSGGVVTKRINQIAAKTIDFIELIFDAIIDDDDISDTIKALLLRLQIPIIKASMLDPEFFIYDSHPARVLLDSIAEVGVGVNDREDETYIELGKVVSVILDEYDLQADTFEKALNKLKAYIKKQEALARAKEEAVQKQVLREHARNTVLKTLRTITTGKTLPEKIHTMVLKRWPTLMFNHYLEHGRENEEWQVITEALREIVESVQPFSSADALAHLKHVRVSLLTRARGFLKKTSQSREDLDKVLLGLAETHENMISRADFKKHEIEAADQRLAADKNQVREKPAASSHSERQPLQVVPTPRLPRNIMPGMWFHISIGDDKPARRAKLSVIIVEDSKLVFVNHKGDIIVEKGFDEFEKEVDQGASKVIMGHSVFDHALSSVITQLRPAQA